MMKLLLLPVLALALMGAKCEKGSDVNSDPMAYCQTHFQTPDTCAGDARCVWDDGKSKCTEK